MLVSVMTYREITGDSETASAEAERALAEAQGRLEDELERPLEQGTLPALLLLTPGPVTGGATRFPPAAPLLSVQGGRRHQHGVIYGAPPTTIPSVGLSATPPPAAEVTYTAGFDPAQTHPTAEDYLPRYIERDI